MGFFLRAKELFSVKKFLFFLNLETGGYFTNSYNLFLSVFVLLGSIFLPTTVIGTTNVIFYVISLFIYVGLAVSSLYALKGMEDGNRFKISLGFVATVIWLIILVSAFFLACFAGTSTPGITIGAILYIFVLSIIHLYLLVNMIFMYRFSG